METAPLKPIRGPERPLPDPSSPDIIRVGRPSARPQDSIDARLENLHFSRLFSSEEIILNARRDVDRASRPKIVPELKKHDSMLHDIEEVLSPVIMASATKLPLRKESPSVESILHLGRIQSPVRKLPLQNAPRQTESPKPFSTEHRNTQSKENSVQTGLLSVESELHRNKITPSPIESLSSISSQSSASSSKKVDKTLRIITPTRCIPSILSPKSFKRIEVDRCLSNDFQQVLQKDLHESMSYGLLYNRIDCTIHNFNIGARDQVLQRAFIARAIKWFFECSGWCAEVSCEWDSGKLKNVDYALTFNKPINQSKLSKLLHRLVSRD